ncbi:hypothetical protein [Halobacillus sp. H74]|uniref:hypothetical protein n=1 Tax=Halobacillus sp. H74 TaxID=3457436 RepID=UPI003FCC91AB
MAFEWFSNPRGYRKNPKKWQNLMDIDTSGLNTGKELPFKVREFKFGIKACYIFYGKYDVPLYVGSTKCIRKRMYQHMNNTSYIDEVEKVEIRITERPNELEMFFIGKLDPYYNKHMIAYDKPLTLNRGSCKVTY